MDRRREMKNAKFQDLKQWTRPNLRFNDLDLSRGTVAGLKGICRRYRDLQGSRLVLARDRAAVIDTGVTALLVGASGIGKTLAARAVATDLGLPLYRIDLASVVNKYIGETEKNLSRLFDVAESAGAVLLLDEADSLLGNRTDVSGSHDRHANVDTELLLRRVEQYSGIAILATNLQTPIDEDLLRRLNNPIKINFA